MPAVKCSLAAALSAVPETAAADDAAGAAAGAGWTRPAVGADWTCPAVVWCLALSAEHVANAEPAYPVTNTFLPCDTLMLVDGQAPELPRSVVTNAEFHMHTC